MREFCGGGETTGHHNLHKPSPDRCQQMVICEVVGTVRAARNPRGDSVPATAWVSGGRPTRPRRWLQWLLRTYLAVFVAGSRTALPRYATKKGAKIPPSYIYYIYYRLGAFPTKKHSV